MQKVSVFSIATKSAVGRPLQGKHNVPRCALTCEWANDELESQSDEFDANRDELELDVCEAIEPLSSVSLWFSAATEYSSDS